MNISVKILESESVKTQNGSIIKKPKNHQTNPSQEDGKLIHIYENDSGSIYGVIVMPDGSLKKVQTSLIKVIDSQYL